MRKEVDDAVQMAISDPLLPVDAVYMDIFHSTPNMGIRGLTSEQEVHPKFETTAQLLAKQ